MSIYALTPEGAITFLSDRKPAKGEEVFSDDKSLREAIRASCPQAKGIAAFLVKAFNSLPGVKQVKKFENLEIAAARILKATVGVKVPGAKAAKASAPAPARAKAAKPQAKAKRTTVGTPGESKREVIITMLRAGATGKEIQVATGWAPHSVRGFISTLGKTESITSTKAPEGGRFYKLG